MAINGVKYSDTEQLMNRKMRSVDGKRIFALIGLMCICLVIALLLMLYAFDRNDDQSSLNFGEEIVIEHIETIEPTKSEKSVQKRNVPDDESMEKSDDVEVDRFKRFKRQLTMNPVDYYEQPTVESLRQKRLSDLSEKLKEMQSKFEHCRNFNPIPSDCEQFHREMVEVYQALDHEIQLSKFGPYYDSQNYAVDEPTNHHQINFGKFADLPSDLPPGEIALHELNREDKVLQSVNEFSPFPRVHEELENRHLNSWNINEQPQNVPMQQPSVPMPIPSVRDNDKINPLKAQNFDPSGQILRICDQISQQNIHPDQQPPQINNVPEFSGSVTNIAQPHSPNFQPNFQSVPLVQQQLPQQQQPQQQPISTAPIFYRSSPQPVCLYPQPQQVQLGQSLIIPPQFVAPVATGNAANRFVLVNSNSQQFGATSPSGQGFIQVLNARSEHLPATNHTHFCPFAVQSQVATQIPAPALPIQKSSPTNEQQGLDSFYASLANRLASINVTNPFNECKTGETSCINSAQCIPNERWCDNIVDCRDASDETTCSCISRLDSAKLCDGYLDCPLGSDEIGCFGCARNQFSCFSNKNEFQMSQFESGTMCYTLEQKCDGFTHCLNGRDEEECSMLIKAAELHTTFMVPYTEGILYRNFRGRWYPVCENPMDWATEACEAEMDELTELPEIQIKTGTLPGPYLSKISQLNTQTLTQQIRFSDTCPMDPQSHTQSYTWAKCPELKCGTTKRLISNIPSLRIRDENERNKRNEYLRIVGGDRSTPHSWPYIVALYKNGHFHCGGTILSSRWIISAAHCVTKAEKNYYEVQAGLLRRYSFAPEVQISKVTHVIVNTGYDQYEMVNDISLLRLEKPLIFNRWVRPICLPTPERVTMKFDQNWMFGPPPGTVCTVIGWGDLLENGESSDNLEEVNVPILKACKDIIDVNGNEICAGEAAGGRDACQGDSGGPFVCQSNADPHQSYLAGIVSHGEGCARRNEPGVYTRVALYVDWINAAINSDLSITAKSTRSNCPGFVCLWSNRCISNRSRCNNRIDCLGGEDELNCAFDPVGTSRKRIGRQNDQIELPNDGNSGSGGFVGIEDGNTNANLNDDSHDELVRQTVTTTELPPVLPNPDVSQSTVPTIPMQKSTKPETVTETTLTMADATTQTPVSVITSPESVIQPELDPNNDADNASSIKKIDHRDDFLTTTESSTDISIDPSTSTTIATVTSTTISTTKRPSTTTAIPITTTTSTTTTVAPSTTTIKVPSTTTTLAPSTTTTLAPSTTTTLAPSTTTTTEKPSTTTVRITTTTSTTPIPITPPKPNELTFECLDIPQTISRTLRCDGHSDCEDGSDEKNCTCRESLHNKQERLICDGVSNCLDGEDEVGCLTCSTDEYGCQQSKKCIPKTSRCNKHNDCEFTEDEDDCFALTDGNVILMDHEFRPRLHHKGIVCENNHGNWSVKCVRRGSQHENTQLAELVCFSLGFSGYTFFNVSRVDDKGEIQRARDPHVGQVRNDYYQSYLPNARQAGSFGRAIYKRSTSVIDQMQPHEIIVGAPSKSCSALYLECVPHSHVPIDDNNSNTTTEHPAINPEPTTENINHQTTEPSTSVHPSKDPEHEITTITPIEPNNEHENATELRIIEDNFKAPWLASIYIDGDLKCIGVLLDRQWVLVENSCVEDADLDQNVIVVVLGKSQNIMTPFEKIHRVNCDKKLKSGAGTVLFLPNAVQFDRYTLPTYIPPSINDEDSDCVAVAHGQRGGFISVPVIRNDTDCPNDQKNCYQAVEPLENVVCSGFDASTHGVVVCTDTKNSTYYPISLFTHEDGLCSFNNLSELELLEPSYSNLQLLINWPMCTYKKDNVECEGHRCPLGKCIPNDRVCDRKRDCHDGSDETDEICKEKGKCGSNEIKCADGKGCIPKIRFCDKIVDCTDGSDEPGKCTCRAYLALTDESKICDGTPHCADKSDELNCPCHQNSYKCGSGECIPAQFICDNQNDCPQGEDESACVDYSQQPQPQQSSSQSNYYQYNQRSSSEWHSSCHSEPMKPTKTELMEDCSSVGETDANPENILYQLIDSEQDPAKDGESLKVIATNMHFTHIEMNHKFNLTIINPRRKTPQPLDANDCLYLLEFNCGLN